MNIDVLIHRGLFGNVFALESISADLDRTAMPCVDCGFGASESVGIPHDKFSAKELGSPGQQLEEPP